jgi:hypothetical protein
MKRIPSILVFASITVIVFLLIAAVVGCDGTRPNPHPGQKAAFAGDYEPEFPPVERRIGP